MIATFTKSQIFTAAWELAMAYAAEAGTGSKAQFARALRETYASFRQVEASARWSERNDYLNALGEDRAGVVAAPEDRELLSRLTALDSTIVAAERALLAA
ncbi:hypothetical protein [Methylobacterium komagatae]